MKKPHINAANWKSYSDGIAEKRESWVKETSATIVCIMEWKRFILGLSMDDYYGGLLHYKMNPRTCRKMLDGESNVPMELFLSFCFTFGYDIKRFAASSEFLTSGRSNGDYLRIGAAVEALGKSGVCELASNISSSCASATFATRRQLARVLRDFADSMERTDDIATDEASLNRAIDSVNAEAANEIERLKRVQDREEVTADVI
jgi:hypothetical protein